MSTPCLHQKITCYINIEIYRKSQEISGNHGNISEIDCCAIRILNASINHISLIVHKSTRGFCSSYDHTILKRYTTKPPPPLQAGPEKFLNLIVLIAFKRSIICFLYINHTSISCCIIQLDVIVRRPTLPISAVKSMATIGDENG